MKTRPTAWQAVLFLVLAISLSLSAQLFRQAGGFSFTHRDFRPSPVSVVLTAAVFLAILFSLWVFYSRAVATLLAQPPAAVLSVDFLSFLPFLFLSLAPLALRHFIGASDLRARLELFLLAAAGAFFYLKVVAFRRLAADTETLPWRKWWRSFLALPLKRRLIVLFAAALIVFNVGSLVMLNRGATFSGDEPHYLMISHSLLRDGDFDLADDYARRDYSEFMLFEGEIAPHVVRGAKPGRLYSFHSPGVSILLLPFYAAGSLFKGKALVLWIRLGMSFWGALFGVQVYLLARSLWGKESLAAWVWFLASFTSPVFFYAIHVYPEIVVASLALTAYRLLRYSPSMSAARAALCGLCLGSFIWFHALKYIALLGPLFLYGLWAVRRKSTSRGGLILYILVPAAVIALYLQFQHALYGTYSLFAVSWARPLTGTQQDSLRFAGSVIFDVPLRDRLETLAGYFLDQRDGLLFYAPLYFFSLLGAWEMIKKRRRELVLLLFLSAPYLLLSAALTQRAGYAPQARPMVAVIWTMIIALGYFLTEDRGLFSRLKNFAACLSLVFVVLLLRQPLNLYQETTRGATQRGGGLFFLLSNLHFDLTKLLPSYLKVEDRSWLPNTVWPALLALFILAYALSKKSETRSRYSGHAAAACAAVAVFFAAFGLYPRLVLVNPTRVKLPDGERATFYSLSRSAKRAEGGQFFLREDGRAYAFYLVTEKPIAELGFEFGSEYGEYDSSLRLFDEPLVETRTVREVRSIRLDRPPRYELGRRSFYEIVLVLGKGTVAASDQRPYLFTINIRQSPG